MTAEEILSIFYENILYKKNDFDPAAILKVKNGGIRRVTISDTIKSE